MAKSVNYTKSVGLPVARAHAVVTSEAYLLTVDETSDGSSSNLVVESGERTVEPDGTVNAAVVASQPASTSDDGASIPAMSVEQTTVVTPLVGGRFTVSSVTALPKGMGSMTLLLEYRGGQDSTDGQDAVSDAVSDAAAVTADAVAVTAVDATVTAEVKIPLLGGKLAAKLLEKSEDSVDKAIRRVNRLSGEL
ncbi:MAG: DUF2505 family protein [Candidatus Corynebacterium faecigallinarum]